MYKFLTLISFVALFCCDKSVAWLDGEQAPGFSSRYHAGWAGVPAINPERAGAQLFNVQSERDQLFVGPRANAFFGARDGVVVAPRAAAFAGQAGWYAQDGRLVSRAGLIEMPKTAFRDGLATGQAGNFWYAQDGRIRPSFVETPATAGHAGLLAAPATAGMIEVAAPGPDRPSVTAEPYRTGAYVK